MFLPEIYRRVALLRFKEFSKITSNLDPLIQQDLPPKNVGPRDPTKAQKTSTTTGFPVGGNIVFVYK